MWYGIESTRVEWVAFTKPFYGEPNPEPTSVLNNALFDIFRTGGGKPAPRAQER